MNLDTATHVDAALHLVNCNAVGSPHIVELHISQCRFKCKLKHHCTEIPVPKGVEGIVWGSSTYMGRGSVHRFLCYKVLKSAQAGSSTVTLVRFPNPLAFGSDFPKSGGDPV